MKTTRRLLILTIAAVALCGCQLFNGDKPVVTPARVQAVASVAGYYGGKAAIGDGKRREMELLRASLLTIQSAQTPDMAAIIAAIQAAKIPLPGGKEGEFLFLMGAIFFDDLWSGTGQVALEQPHVKAFLAGVVNGLSLALDAPASRAIRGEDFTGAALEAKAANTRPKP